MRLSTERDRDDDRSVAVLHAAFDAGVDFVDTSDAYCWDANETGHNERLIARALSTWNGDRTRITIATKGGLTRPNGSWIPDGRAKHLAAACEASLRALNLDRIALYQLHAPDPRTPLTTSVRALEGLRRDGLVETLGLCNVNVAQIEDARTAGEIAAIQVELSPWKDDNVLNGVLEYCAAHQLRLFAFRPLGGAKGHRRLANDALLSEIGARHDATPHEIALSWLAGLSPVIVVVPGVTRVETARSVARAHRVVLSADERARLDEHFPTGRAARFRASAGTSSPALRADGEIVLVMGLPGAGKSTVARTLASRGYARLNRDETGGTLKSLLPALERIIVEAGVEAGVDAGDSGASRIVLDNTYMSRKARAPVVQAGWKMGMPVRCLWLSTSIDDAQVNAVTRMIRRYGRLLMPDEMREAVKTDVSAFGPGVQFRYQRELEAPAESEGFSRIDVLPFDRRYDSTATNRAVILWCDGILSRSRSGQRTPATPDDLDVIDGRADVLRRWDEEGWYVLGLSWQPEISAGTRTHEQVFETFAKLRESLGVEMDIEYARTRVVHRCAGAGSRCPASALRFCSATGSIRANASTSATDRRMPRSRASSGSSTRRPRSSSSVITINREAGRRPRRSRRNQPNSSFVNIASFVWLRD